MPIDTIKSLAPTLALTCLACAAGTARADLRLTARVHVTRTGDSTPALTAPDDDSTTLTALFRGDRARIEAGDTIVIYDLGAKRVYRLNAADKTYTVLPLHGFLAQARFGAGRTRPAEFVDSSLKADLTADLRKDAVVEAREFAGKQAKLYDLEETVTLHPDVAEGPRGGGGGGGFGRGGGRRGRGGGFPGGGGGAPRERRPQSLGGAKVNGEVWIAADVATKMRGKRLVLPLFASAMPYEPALDALADKVARAGGFPVSTKLTTTWRSSRSSSDDGPTTTVAMDVSTISEDPLDEGLFKVPADYAKDTRQ
ncbi:MAG TPA: hypothetical protein VKT77_15680 [Chthonomonadaceae bacterium]|nr:hypothetical protein [Chthonomonadaceae bacterium]